MENKYKKATFSGGCFWCTEAVFERLKGVKKTVPGYTGGDKKDPSYEEVSSGTTGHAEAVQITYDPSEIKYEDLLYVFFKTHDPTTLNRQGNDVGTQYRSEIFYHSGEQKKEAEEMLKKLNSSGQYEDDIVTKISHIREFFPAEDYHHNYYENNENKPYCRLVIDPKIEKLQKELKKYLK
ncbi:peptide-methionine (S)-S-oxide reductase MsrA [Candidatus Woesebacteria bacterium]|nr:peptide-methionine (S)-S-oxide reductase MsrA [Candidatus Woesebacteria bacterium]